MHADCEKKSIYHQILYKYDCLRQSLASPAFSSTTKTLLYQYLNLVIYIYISYKLRLPTVPSFQTYGEQKKHTQHTALNEPRLKQLNKVDFFSLQIASINLSLSSLVQNEPRLKQLNNAFGFLSNNAIEITDCIRLKLVLNHRQVIPP